MEKLATSDMATLIAVIVLGATGVYLLLPHRHGLTKPRRAHQVGFTLATLGLLAFTLTWKQHGGELLGKVFFYLLSFGAVGAAILTIISRDPVHSALWFAAVVLSTSGLFLLAGAQFLAAGTVIVYAGAIIVTFLFVIMLAQKEGRAIYDRMARSPFWATFASFLLLFTLLYAILALRIPPTADAPRREDMASRTRYPITPAIVRLDENNPDQSRALTKDQGEILRRALPPSSELPENTRLSAPTESTRLLEPTPVPHVAALGWTLYTEHLVTVELAGALLFSALIGALAIATPKAPIRPSTSDAAPNA